MRKACLSVFLLLAWPLLAQNPDSLDIILRSTVHDTVKTKKLNQQSWNFLVIGDHRNSYYYALEAKKMAQKSGFAKGLARAYNNVGNALYLQGNYPEALVNFLEALKLNERMGDKEGAAISYNNIGNLYDSMEKYDDAVKSHLKALELRKNSTNKYAVAQSYHNIGLAYCNKKEYPKALENFFGSLAISRELRDTLMEATCYASLAIVYTDLKDYREELRYNLMALKLREQVGEQDEIAKSIANIGENYLLLNDLKQAEKYGRRAYEAAHELDNVELKEVASLALSNIYARKGEYSKALEYYKEHVVARESRFNSENTEKVVQAKMNFEFERERDKARLEQEKKDLLVKEEGRIKELQLSRSRYLAIALVAVMILLLFGGFILMRQNRLRGEQRSMQLEQKLLRSQMNPHFIFNSLIAIESFIYKNEPRAAGRYLSGFAKLMRAILENSREEYVPLEKEVSALKHYLELQQLRFEEGFTYSIHVQEDINAEEIAIPPMLAQPFIENSIEHGIKHSHTAGKIEIKFSKQGSDLLFEVRDNGVGLERSAAMKGSEEKHHSLATLITNERLNLLNKGKSQKIKIFIDDVKDPEGRVRGACVSFRIPFREI